MRAGFHLGDRGRRISVSSRPASQSYRVRPYLRIKQLVNKEGKGEWKAWRTLGKRAEGRGGELRRVQNRQEPAGNGGWEEGWYVLRAGVSVDSFSQRPQAVTEQDEETRAGS